MTDSAKRILDAALALSSDERRRLGYALLQSVGELGEGDDAPAELSDAWKREIARRIDEVVRGDVELRDADEVADELRHRFG